MAPTIDGRKRNADRALQPAAYFSYVLQFDDEGSFYVGSTNAPLARISEHAIGVGAKTTKGRSFSIRLVQPFLSRREAEYNEKRLRTSLAKGPEKVNALIEAFNHINNLIHPQKTFSQLRNEERMQRIKMERVFHHSTNLAFQVTPLKPTACGWVGKHYGTQDWGQLKKMARDEDFTGNIYGRKVCRACLEHAPA